MKKNHHSKIFNTCVS